MTASKARIRIQSPGDWRKKHANRHPLVNKEKIGSSYLDRILRLTLPLAANIIEAILDGRQPKGLALVDFMEPFPIEWEEE
jgi:hypothetical protein